MITFTFNFQNTRTPPRDIHVAQHVVRSLRAYLTDTYVRVKTRKFMVNVYRVYSTKVVTNKLYNTIKNTINIYSICMLQVTFFKRYFSVVAQKFGIGDVE